MSPHALRSPISNKLKFLHCLICSFVNDDAIFLVDSVSGRDGSDDDSHVPPPKIVHKTLGRGGCPWNIYSSGK